MKFAKFCRYRRTARSRISPKVRGRRSEATAVMQDLLGMDITPDYMPFKPANYGKILPMFSLKNLSLLDPNVTYLNHGSFGACPRPVFEAYQRWQRELEQQPVEFLARRATGLMAEAREKLATYLQCATDEVVYFPNPTTALNMVARSLELGPGDEVLSTDHEYGALDRTWRFLSRDRGFSYINHPIVFPLTSEQDFIDDFWSGVTPNTRVIFL